MIFNQGVRDLKASNSIKRCKAEVFDVGRETTPVEGRPSDGMSLSKWYVANVSIKQTRQENLGATADGMMQAPFFEEAPIRYWNYLLASGRLGGSKHRPSGNRRHRPPENIPIGDRQQVTNPRQLV